MLQRLSRRLIRPEGRSPPRGSRRLKSGCGDVAPRDIMASTLLRLLVLLAVFSQPLQLWAAELVSGPFVEAITATNAVIRWTTDVVTGSRVHFGPNPAQMSQKRDGELGIQHRVALAGLQPGTRYHFTAGTARFPLATNSFVTVELDLGTSTNAAEKKAPGKIRSEPVAAAPSARETWGQIASLQDHFDRHGGDFNAKSPEDYARLAWEFLQRAKSGALLMKVDDEGVLRVFDPRSRSFAAYNRNGTTKTFFKPGSADYYERQPGRNVKPEDLKFR